MKMRARGTGASAFFLLVACLLAAAGPAWSACGKRSFPGKATRENVRLTGSREQPGFYWRTKLGEVLFFRSEDVLSSLKSGSADGSVAPATTGSVNARLVARLSRDLPLEANSDLLTYVLEAPELGARIEVLVGDLLASGRVYISRWAGFYRIPEPETREIEVVSHAGANGELLARWFCTPAGRPLMEIYYINY
jgi:hypothetical protein